MSPDYRRMLRGFRRRPSHDAQAEIEATLNDLINALRKVIEDRAGGT